jgi:hypothetical protein
MLGLSPGARNLSRARLGVLVVGARNPQQGLRNRTGTLRARGPFTTRNKERPMKKTKTDRKPLQLNTETLRLLGQELENVAGGIGVGVGGPGNEPEAFPTNKCNTIFGSFGGNCCNTKLA